MKIVFLGSSEFALPSLQALNNRGYHILCVVTQPDRRKKRGLDISATPVKTLALDLKLKIFQPEDINAEESKSFLKNLEADLFVVVSFGQILSEEIINMPKIFSINLHASLLPKYRGPAPVNWALLNGEEETGVTIMKVVKKIDAGPIILQKKERIFTEDNAITLSKRLSYLGADLLLQAIELIRENKFRLIPQDETKVSLAPLLKKNDGQIDWSKSAIQIYNLIRGCAGWPGAFTYYKDRLLKIHKAYVFDDVDFFTYKPGEIVRVEKDKIIVSTGRGFLVITELQIECRRKMSVVEFICGYKIKAGEFLETKFK